MESGTEFESQRESNPAGEAVVAELLWIHGLIRDSLKVVQNLAVRVEAGAKPQELRDEVNELKANNIVWTLRVNCLRYCRFVHGHHGLEDAAVFPGLRKVNPMLNPVIDRLEEDHRVVSDLLDSVEKHARELESDDRARMEMGHALSTLAEHLLEHLEFEEASLTPTLSRLSGWNDLW